MSRLYALSSVSDHQPLVIVLARPCAHNVVTIDKWWLYSKRLTVHLSLPDSVYKEGYSVSYPSSWSFFSPPGDVISAIIWPPLPSPTSAKPTAGCQGMAC